MVNLLPQDPIRARLYGEWMEGHKPPGTLVGVQSLASEELVYEIEVNVVVNSG